MTRQAKLDIAAAAAISLMFLGMFVITSSLLGMIPIAVGFIAMVALFVVARR